MRLLLIADTHVPVRARDLPATVWDEVDRADLVIHAGDWVDLATLDALQARIRTDVYERGVGMVAATKVDGRAHLKLTLLNPMATAADLGRLVDEVVATGHALAAGDA